MMVPAPTMLLTMDEAADALCMSRRSLQDWLADYPVDSAGIPFYVPNGNRKLFAPSDIARILAAKREKEARRIKNASQRPGSSSRPGRGKRRSGRSAERTPESLWTTAREFLTSARPSVSSRRGERSQSGRS
jgi:hypothetical protein